MKTRTRIILLVLHFIVTIGISPCMIGWGFWASQTGNASSLHLCLLATYGLVAIIFGMLWIIFAFAVLVAGLSKYDR